MGNERELTRRVRENMEYREAFRWRLVREIRQERDKSGNRRVEELRVLPPLPDLNDAFEEVFHTLRDSMAMSQHENALEGPGAQAEAAGVDPTESFDLRGEAGPCETLEVTNELSGGDEVPDTCDATAKSLDVVWAEICEATKSSDHSDAIVRWMATQVATSLHPPGTVSHTVKVAELQQSFAGYVRGVWRRRLLRLQSLRTQALAAAAAKLPRDGPQHYKELTKLLWKCNKQRRRCAEHVQTLIGYVEDICGVAGRPHSPYQPYRTVERLFEAASDARSLAALQECLAAHAAELAAQAAREAAGVADATLNEPDV